MAGSGSRCGAGRAHPAGAAHVAGAGCAGCRVGHARARRTHGGDRGRCRCRGYRTRRGAPARRRLGGTRWRTNVDGVRRARPAVSATTIAVTTDTEVVIIDRATGQVRASARIDGPAAPAIAPSPVATAEGGEFVIVASESGVIAAVDAKTGAPRWSAHYGGSVVMAPMVDRGVVVANLAQRHQHSPACPRCRHRRRAVAAGGRRPLGCRRGRRGEWSWCRRVPG